MNSKINQLESKQEATLRALEARELEVIAGGYVPAEIVAAVLAQHEPLPLPDLWAKWTIGRAELVR